MEPVHVIRHPNTDFDGNVGYYRSLLYSGIKRKRGCGQRRKRVVRSAGGWLFRYGVPVLLKRVRYL